MQQKILSVFAALGLIVTGCSIKEDRMQCLAPVSVHINDLSVTQEDYPGTKADPIPATGYSGINAITLAFYTPSGTERYKTTQLKSDASSYTTFGVFDLSLPMDSYTLVAVAYTTKDESPFTLSGPTEAAYTGAHAYDTYVAAQDVDITSTGAIAIEATLERICSQLQVVSTDGKTANAAKVQMTLSAGGKSFNPSTGLATVNTGLVNTVNISSSVGEISRSNTVFFLASDEQTLNVTVDVLDAGGSSISHKVVSNVPFKRNRVTRLSGSLYSTGASASIQIDTTWLNGANVGF